jgi:HK97 family phage portal protein
MAWWNLNKRREQRASVENPTVPISSRAILEFFGLSATTDAGVTVTIDSALGIPAIWAAVNFISGTVAGLPLNLYRKTGQGRERVSGGLATLLHDAWNDETSSFDGRKYSMEQVLTGGRIVVFIERNPLGRIINLWPLVPDSVTVERKAGRKLYRYTENGRTVTYAASEVIDIPFMLKPDMITSRSPLLTCCEAIALGLASTSYGAKFFQNGGVPPFAITGPFQTDKAMQRAMDDLHEAVKKAAKEKRQAIALPSGHEIKQIGADAEKSQLVELKKQLIEEYARIYSLPPVFLQDLTKGTFSNTEQQDLHLVKHTIKRWVEQIEQEMNLKLFGRYKTNQYVEFNLDGLLRGDLKSRIEAYAKGIQNAVYTPDECRAMENRTTKGGDADKLHIQGATVPLGSQPKNTPAPAPKAPEEDDEE